MSGARSSRVALVALVFALVSSAFVGGALTSDLTVAGAANPHRAAVIVDTGADVHRVVITFTEDSITGIDALRKAGANPAIYTTGIGGAVCAIYGVGRPAGPNCFVGSDGDSRYWAYFRAPAGASTFTYSSVGAGITRVHDGDVEGWKWGTGTAPAFVSLASLLPPPAPPATRPPTTAPATNAPTAAAPGSGTSAGPTSPATGVAGAPGSSSALPVTGAATAPPGATATTRAGSDRASTTTTDRATSRDGDVADGRTVGTALASSDEGSSGSSAWSLLWFAGLIAAIVGAVFVVRRVRGNRA